MRPTASDFEAALRRKRPAGGEPSRPPKRPRSRDPPRPAATATEVTSTRVSEERRPVERVAPRPATTEVEEGEIATTTEAAVVVIDEEEVSAAAAMPEAVQVTVATGPQAAAEPTRERTPPAARVGGRTGEREQGGTEAAPRAPRPETRAPTAETRGPPVPLTIFRGSGATEGPGNVRSSRRPDPMDNAVEAHRLTSGLRTQEFDKAMEGKTHSELLDMMMVTIVQMGNAAIGIRDALGHSSASLTKALAKARKYREESAARGEDLARLQAESAAREGGLSRRLKEAESRASAAEARAELALERLKGALERVSAVEGAAAAEKTAAEEARAAKERAVAEAMAEKAGAVACADEAAARAGEAEEKAREAESRAQEAVAAAERAEERAREAEAQAKEAESRAQQAVAGAEKAVAEFKASDEFKQEMVESGLAAYVQGFEMCKSRVAVALRMNVAELEGIQPGGDDEEPAGSQGAEEPAPGEQNGGAPPEEPAPGDV